MLHMVLHIPIQKSHKATTGVGAATKAKIRRIRTHANVLGHADKHRQPVAIGRRQIDDENQNPIASRDENGREQ